MIAIKAKTKHIYAPVALLGLAVCAMPAHAVPALQVYLPGGSYDNTEEGWAINGNSVEVVVAGASTPGWAHIIRDVSLWVAIDEADYMANPTGSVTLTDEFGGQVFANGTALSGTPAPLNPHGIYPAYYYEFSLADLLVGTAGETVYDYNGDFDPQNVGGADRDTGDLAAYLIEFTGFSSIHLDLSGTVSNSNGTRERLVVAPYSHDAEIYSDIPLPPGAMPVPEPGMLVLMGTGLLGLGLAASRRKGYSVSMV